jgi:hypothetical protein
MDIFIDTSVIYTDPFWKRNFSRQLLTAARDKQLNIFIADLVISELKYNFEKQLDVEFGAIVKANNSIKKISRRHSDIITPTKDQYLQDFDNFYKELFKTPNIKALTSDKDIFPELIERAVARQKPFTDSRSEFKDAVIWTTYYKYAKSKVLTDCHLLTTNKKDFTDKEGNLHNELRKDYDKFTIHLTVDEFYKAKIDVIEKPIKEFKEWIGTKTIDEKFVYSLLGDNEKDKVFSEVQNKFENLDPSYFLDGRESAYVLGGISELISLAWYDCRDIEVDIIGDHAIISGVLRVEADLYLNSHNSSRDLADKNYPYYKNFSKPANVYFNFIYDKEEKPKNFDVIEIV